jgi:hypothetical protein
MRAPACKLFRTSRGSPLLGSLALLLLLLLRR